MNEHVTVIDQFDAWRQALATGKPVAYERGAPTAGYFKRTRRISATDRTKVYDAVAIWREDDEWVCLTSGGFTPTGADAIEDMFVSINSCPISFELFEAISVGGAWPDAVAPVDPPAPDLPPHQATVAELKSQQDAIKEWLRGLKDAEGKPRKPATQAEADKAANWGNEFHKIEKKAEKLRIAEKAPHLEKAEAVDDIWNPIKASAKTAKEWAKGLSDEYARVESARRKKEVDDANAEAQRKFNEAKALAAAEDQRNADLKVAGVRMPEAAPPIVAPKPIVAAPVMVGTVGKRQSLRKVPTYALTDGGALLHYLADRNERSLKLLEAALADGKALCEAGMKVPGILVGEKEEMR